MGSGLVVCALAREAAKVGHAASPHPVITMGPGEHFARAFSSYLGRSDPKPAWALLAGYSGSLSPSVAPGAVVIATEVLDANTKRLAPTWVTPRLTISDGVVHHGPICTSTSLIATASEKEALGQRTGALAVDMESAAFGLACNRFNIPWAVVRLVFDSMKDPLHPNMLRWCDHQGRDNLAALAWDLLTSPGWWWHLPGWGKRDRSAGKSLASAVRGLIQAKP